MIKRRDCDINCRAFSNFGFIIFLAMVQGLQCHKGYKIESETLKIIGLTLNSDSILLPSVTIVPIRDEISAPLLSCWTCHHGPDSPDNDCIHMNNRHNITKTVCHLYQPFCQIQRLEEDGKVEKLVRTCSQKCDSGCHRYQSIKSCESCCTQPLCNIGNVGNTRQLDIMPCVMLLAAGVYMLKE